MTRTFNLTRQFALLSFIGILLTALLSGFLMSRFLTDKLLSREATLTAEFVDSVVDTDQIWHHFEALKTGVPTADFEYFFRHLSELSDVVHANVYLPDDTVLWATDSSLIGGRFEHNEELDQALAGQLAFETGVTGVPDGKEEHQHMGDVETGLHFVEIYIPIWNQAHTRVLGVVELYKEPRVLNQSIAEAVRLVWVIALLSATLLYLTLFWVVRRAAATIDDQHRRLMESESLGMIGETASAVAHAMRNPLASIRASAELTLSDDLEGARESARDIIGETDRLDRWARQLLQFARADSAGGGRADVGEVLAGVLDEHAPMLERFGVTLRRDFAAAPLVVAADPTPLAQVFANLVVNAIEAMPDGGHLTLSAQPSDGPDDCLEVRISDTGNGLPESMRERLFKPFATTKPSGTGIGLALSQRLLRHYRGRLEIDSPPGGGLTATVTLPRCAPQPGGRT